MVLPPGLEQFWRALPSKLQHRWYRADLPATAPNSVAGAMATLRTGALPAPPGLIPITYVDNLSFACVVCRPKTGKAFAKVGHVVRWHLDAVPDDAQGQLLDTDVKSYVQSLIEESDAYQAGYTGGRGHRGHTFEGVLATASKYEMDFGTATGRRPKPEDLRPFQLACQNVIIGLAALRHEPRINALIVEYWQTCEASHVATNEANRALLALMLCDAFQAGGTMELNFSKHPEGRVPAGLRRYARAVGIALASDQRPDAGETAQSISPDEARKLFLAVTPMPEPLRRRVNLATATGLISCEQICYSLLSPIWRAIELDFILGCSGRAYSILQGGSPIDDQLSRQPEVEMTRAALLVGMYFRRLDSKDLASGTAVDEGTSVRQFEDSSRGVTWTVETQTAAVRMHSVSAEPLPWQEPNNQQVYAAEGEVIVLPRPHPTSGDTVTVQNLRDRYPGVPIVILTFQDSTRSTVEGATTLRAPDPRAYADAQIERNFTSARLGRE